MWCLNKSYNRFNNKTRTLTTFENHRWLKCTLISLSVFLCVFLICYFCAHNLAKNRQQQDEEEQERLDAVTNLTERRRNGDWIDFDQQILDDADADDVEYIKPIKIGPLPLNDHDIIYDQLRNQQQQQQRKNKNDHPEIRHHSGNFRHKSAEIWDPHPQYEIVAFGRKFVLELAHDDKFISPNLHVIHMWKNFSQRIKHDEKTSGCYYNGIVRDDQHSNVVVSLCNGMTGYIKTSHGSFYIEPVEIQKQSNTDAILLHKIKRLRPVHHPDVIDASVGDGSFGGWTNDQCDESARKRHDHDEEINFDEDVLSTTNQTHILHKRSTNFYQEFPQQQQQEDADDFLTFDAIDKIQFINKNPFYVEILVVADKKMIYYHKTNENLIHYILTLMSHVSLLYKDASIGNPITLAVVDIMILRDEEFTSSTSQEMLHKFCKFQYNHSQKLHDVALLFTREEICKNASVQYCNTLGVAEVGSMCSSSSCAIVRDKGLSTAYTIAHELGHVLSMPHDDDKRCAKFRGDFKSNYIMSKTLQNDTKPWYWSTCSKHFLTEFLDSPRSRCLLDVPEKDFITTDFLFSHLLPGENFEVNRQCELEFGPGSTICSYMQSCESLWCSTEEGEVEGCQSQTMPWADGTTCGKGRWCHHGECIARDRNILSPIAGGWGSWKMWGPCSRTCGGGIKISQRECNNPKPENGGPYCTGRSTRFSSCNTQACENDADFREEQCSVFNGNTKGIPGLTRSVIWVPKYGITNPDDYCKLYCRVQHSSAYYLLQEKVIDGTKCGLNSFNICVNGKCQKGGCDNQLGSNQTLDECGVCGGDNSKCELIIGFYNRSNYGYNHVARLPKGSSNIFITQMVIGQMGDDKNYLALKDGETQEYILNGNSIISAYVKDVIYGGLTIKYSGSNQTLETITTPRNNKLTKDVIIEVLTAGKLLAPNISYSYTISKEMAPRYAWYYYTNKWSNCNSICGGEQYALPICKDLMKNQQVDEKFCRATKDYHNSKQNLRKCNQHCKLQWKVVQKSRCSSDCGQGVRSINYNCNKLDKITNSEDIVNEKHCFSLEKPVKTETCYGPCDSTRWLYDEWSSCTKTCGGGIRVRSAKCVDQNWNKLDESYCDINKKFTEDSCNTGPCPTWAYGEWTPCSVTCGPGFRTRPYYCHIDNQIYNQEHCNTNELEVIKQTCSNEITKCEEPRPNSKWLVGNWTDCSNNCGYGIQRRKVNCIDINSYGELEDGYCDELLKPNDTQKCYNRNDNCKDDYVSNSLLNDVFKWVVGKWSECSSSCNGGLKTRSIQCQHQYTHQSHPQSKCESSLKPEWKMTCNNFPCPHLPHHRPLYPPARWKFGGWTKCDHNCEKRRLVLCQDHDGRSLDFAACDGLKKPLMRVKCRKGNCMHKTNNGNGMRNNLNMMVRWKVGKWSPCSKSCGKGEKQRTVSCMDVHTDIKYVDAYCNHLHRPKSTKICERIHCKYIWMEGQWSQCSSSCGHGIRTRTISCHRVGGDGRIDPYPIEFSLKSPASYCDIYNKPNATIDCLETNCNDEFRWVKGAWSQCSHNCGKRGRQIRKISCVDRFGNEVARRFCPKMLRPKRKKRCNESKCLFKNCKEIKHHLSENTNNDYFITVGGKLVKIYCYKMDTNEPEEFISLSESENFAEFSRKRLNKPNTCPYQNDYNTDEDQCDCVENVDNAGKTVFWKVRLNLTSMEIITNDFTFSRQIYGSERISYGTAGDCFSEVENCTRGRFSINLTGSTFRISKNVRWLNYGRKATQRINQSDLRVSGRCGGNCGKCVPDPYTGLKLEIT